MSVTDSGEDSEEFRSLIEMGLDNGIVEEGKSEGVYRVVETGYVGEGEEVEAYLTALRHGKLIERGKFPSWKYEHGTDGVYSAESHPELPSLDG